MSSEEGTAAKYEEYEEETDVQQHEEENVEQQQDTYEEAADEESREANTSDAHNENQGSNNNGEGADNEGEAAEEGAEEQDVTLYSNCKDPKRMIAEMHRIDESRMIIMRGLSSISVQRDDELRVNLLDVCADLQAEEEVLFSPMPDYVSRLINAEEKRHAEYNRNVQPHPECRQSMLTHSNFSGDGRAFVDPRIPLPMPYSLQRFKAQHPEYEQNHGTYHELFYGDRNSGGIQTTGRQPAETN
ncbi:hypothetical protein STCU_11864 [Strigomonas culicis]|uniref:Uncharacterized protein n=1 Tax=Strigomonas culicis TaxID=28005 RepID=S9TCC1_9TRYP|nr:hypothetical protein STCU_11864 [Strigomonas culicis]|eukprot:EPY15647.1 hypothetical protein STCU_11864 [Strigomonas culicis]